MLIVFDVAGDALLRLPEIPVEVQPRYVGVQLVGRSVGILNLHKLYVGDSPFDLNYL